MKATGIVRRIDDLGRVVVPKEIRRTLRIREGDPLEIFTDREGEIILKKYSPIGEMGQFAKQYADALAQTLGQIVCIADRDAIIAACGGRKELLMKPISPQLEEVMNERKPILPSEGNKKYYKLIREEEKEAKQVIWPIICEGDSIGVVAILSKDNKKELGEVEEKAAACAAVFLARQMEQ
ncbi:MAG: AbrB family transcriptional regulator, stage sporulation protein [Clostridiales bacterium]|nr:AbrB family transcriptional regulator, stage sporulation protein [Clostridiales bacterium]